MNRASESPDESATVLDHRAKATGAERNTSHEVFMTRIRSIISLHPHAGANMDDSRESIYAGCGE